MTLRFAEEFLLLALEDESGRMCPLPRGSLDLAIAGALLMELAFANRIDTDSTKLFVLSREPLNDSLLDEVLEAIPEPRESEETIRNVLQSLSHRSGRWKDVMLDSLVNKGVLRREEHRFLWVFPDRRYPQIDGKEEEEVKSRIRSVVLDSEAIPDPHDVVIVCLAEACGLMHNLFSPQELEASEDRIKLLTQMDFIGQAVAKAILEIQLVVREMMRHPGIPF